MPEWRPDVKRMRQGRWSQDRGQEPANAERGAARQDARKGPCLPRGRTSEGEAARPDRRERRPEEKRKETRSQRQKARQRADCGTGTSDCQAHVVRNCGRRRTEG
ncbi:hypothetical protein NSE01_07570 [Novosphingobium sediminis]|uniref:Uncharacterized protein n=1 Tax=Novosphingobium sediminis TaxID=707214 RepID=A0A512AGU0_9SPHN|nr:hypothetical protein NSE01_07570 [Novosphingobium sediminis]